ncbi:hypothetical protein BDQ17DRAFT_1345938 [Cyathus striatus]|nr:hypothetical protein BDQ17DRAFT_1345938 [Cyathus striatus]
MKDNSVMVQHPPAVKVGGRRLSITSKPKPHVLSEPIIMQSADNEPDASQLDYPRPAPPGSETERQHKEHHQRQEDERKEKKHHLHDGQKDYAFWKAESTRPTRDPQSVLSKSPTAGVRIGQPAGKGFGA